MINFLVQVQMISDYIIALADLPIKKQSSGHQSSNSGHGLKQVPQYRVDAGAARRGMSVISSLVH